MTRKQRGAKPRNYAKETMYESLPLQKKRRAARNQARRVAIKRYGKAALRGKEVDHVGSHISGTLRGIRTRVISKTANRKKQPKRGKK